MLDFDIVLMRHSEDFLLQIVEMWERRNDVRPDTSKTLEDRWDYFIRATDPMSPAAA